MFYDGSYFFKNIHPYINHSITSFKIAKIRVDLPDPTPPAIPTNCPGATSKLIFLKIVKDLGEFEDASYFSDFSIAVFSDKLSSCFPS